MAEITREFDYDKDGDPVMVLRKKRPVVTTFQLEKKAYNSFAIRLRDVWQYSEEHNLDFKRHMWQICNTIHTILDLGLVTTSKLAAVATVIQEGIDDLVKMKPQPAERVTQGEAKVRQSNCDRYVEKVNELTIERPVTIH